jgi:hypothetical protein
MTGDPNYAAQAQSDDDEILYFDVDDAAIERAASSVGGTIPTSSANMVPPVCCEGVPPRGSS